MQPPREWWWWVGETRLGLSATIARAVTCPIRSRRLDSSRQRSLRALIAQGCVVRWVAKLITKPSDRPTNQPTSWLVNASAWPFIWLICTHKHRYKLYRAQHTLPFDLSSQDGGALSQCTHSLYKPCSLALVFNYSNYSTIITLNSIGPRGTQAHTQAMIRANLIIRSRSFPIARTDRSGFWG